MIDLLPVASLTDMAVNGIALPASLREQTSDASTPAVEFNHRTTIRWEPIQWI